MAEPTAQTIRNVVLVSSHAAGKTSLGEALLYSAGAIPSMGAVPSGNTVADFEPEEIHRHATVSSVVLHFDWKGTTFNVIDTPGSLDFLAEAKSAIRAVDGVLVVLDAASEIRTELERLWDTIQEQELPCLLFVNGLDKERTDYDATLEECAKTLGVKVVPVTMPVGSGPELSGVVDLVNRSAFSGSPTSPKVQPREIPADLATRVEEARKRLMEGAAESSDELVEKYLAEGDLTNDEIMQGLTIGTRTRVCVPALCGSAVRNVGIPALLDALTAFLPSPADRATTHAAKGSHPQTGDEVIRQPQVTDPLSGFVFKTIIDPFMGRLTYVRVHSGTLEGDSEFFNASRNTKEKGGHVYHIFGKKYAQAEKVSAGGIAAIGKLKDTQTGDTICDAKHPICFPAIQLSRPVMSFALEPKTKADIDKVSLGLHKLVEEDPSLEFLRNDETKEMLLSGVGQTHIDVTIEKLKRKYGVEVNLQTPKVAYKETIRKSAQAQGKHKKQTGGHGQFGDCWLQLDPLPHGGGFEFVNKIVGGAIPRNYIPAVEKGVVEAMHSGILAGFPVVDIRVTVYDGSHHPVDSSEQAFKVAGSLGFKKAMESAQAVLLEPIMTLEVTIPEDMVGAVIGDLNSRRGRILGMNVKGHNQVVKATVPLAEVVKYAPALTSLTAGKGSYVMEFSGYEEVPRESMNRIIEEHKHAKQAAQAS